MTSRSGKYGKVYWGSSSYAMANKWNEEETADGSQFGVFVGSGQKKGNVGQKGSKGTVNFVYDFDAPIDSILSVGDAITLKLYLTTAASGSRGTYRTGPAQILSLKHETDGDTGAPVGGSFDWQSDGVWTFGQD